MRQKATAAMTKAHARKNKARRLRERTGAAYTSAAAGTLHDHPLIDLAPAAASPSTDMSCASALVAAARAGCSTCQPPLKRHLLTQPEALTALEAGPRLQSITLRTSPHDPAGRLDELLLWWCAALPDSYLRKILRALPVVRALPDEARTTEFLRERYLRVLWHVRDIHGDRGVRAVWNACTGDVTEKALQRAADALNERRISHSDR
ncbi:hypothetical protein AB0393_28095 [Streptomyces cyaneofuscatus]|uniref:hypothetical protein n=1 Tax=Streptomyces cyaneofuscatus TaxID=66883 RepID=UPI00344BE498